MFLVQFASYKASSVKTRHTIVSAALKLLWYIRIRPNSHAYAYYSHSKPQLPTYTVLPRVRCGKKHITRHPPWHMRIFSLASIITSGAQGNFWSRSLSSRVDFQKCLENSTFSNDFLRARHGYFTLLYFSVATAARSITGTRTEKALHTSSVYKLASGPVKTSIAHTHGDGHNIKPASSPQRERT